MTQDITLFETVQGSHVWGMQTEKSDIDLFRCYLSHNNTLLLGHTPYSWEEKALAPQMTTAHHELGTVADQLVIKNNINYYLAIFSPYIHISNYGILDQLKELALHSMSKRAYASIHGMAQQNFTKYIVSQSDISKKRLNTICRNLQFGITYLREKRLEFKPFYEGSELAITTLLKELDKAKEESSLPEEPSYSMKSEVDAFILKTRTKYGYYDS